MSDAEFMGYEAKNVSKSSDGDLTTHQVSKANQNKILDSKGVTEEVRKLVKKADAEIIEEALKFTGERVLKSGKPERLVIGAGADSLAVRTNVRSTNRNIKTGEEVIKYGQTTVSKKIAIPGAIKSTSLADMQAKIEKKWSK